MDALVVRAWGFAPLAEHLESLSSLGRDDRRQAIPDFQVGVGSRDYLIAVAMHRDKHTTGWQS
jgi:hypothetical protein